MFAGHFALAAAVKSRTNRVPLWALMLSTQLLDVAFVPFLLTGKETIETIEGAEGYGSSLIHADYTHSLAGALILALLAGGVAGRRWGRKAGAIVAAVTMSHWAMDLVVHREDLPLLPGNAGDLPLLGLGLWQWPAASMVVELLLVVVGAAMYARSLLADKKSAPHQVSPTKVPARGSWAVWSGASMGILLALSLIWDVAGPG